MNEITINPRPEMCKFIVQHINLLKNNPVLIADVGSRYGYNSEWEAFDLCMKAICFEPDIEECALLNSINNPKAQFIPTALYRAKGQRTFYETKLPDSAGLYRSNMNFFNRLLNRDNAETINERLIDVDTLDNALEYENIVGLNFLKLDAEGAEVDILQGANLTLSDPRLFGVLSEFQFHPEINGSPSFWELDKFLQSQGFRLFNIRTNFQSRRDMPYPGITDYFLPNGERFYAYTEHGQVMGGDALYFRDLLLEQNRDIAEALNPLDIIKFAAFFEIYHHSDAAAELIIRYREKIKSIIDFNELLNKLTPEISGKKLSYDEYIISYFHHDTSFNRLDSKVSPTKDIDLKPEVEDALAVAEIKRKLATYRKELVTMLSNSIPKDITTSEALIMIIRMIESGHNGTVRSEVSNALVSVEKHIMANKKIKAYLDAKEPSPTN